MSDSPTPVGALTVILNQRSATAPYHRETVELQGDEHPGKAIGFDTNGVLGAIDAGSGSSEGGGVWDGTERFRNFSQALTHTNFLVANIVVFGDSWTARGYWPNFLDAALRTQYGYRGIGWLSADKERGNTSAGGGRTGGSVTQAGTWEQRYASDHGAHVHATYVGPDGQVAVSSDVATPASYVFSADAVNVFELYYLLQPNGGSFRWKVDAGGWTTVATANATNALGVVTTSVLSSGFHTFTIEVTVAGTAGVGVFGADCQWTASPNRGIRLHNLPISGHVARYLTMADAALWEACIDRLNPQLAILLYSTNEHDINTTPEDFVTHLDTIIARMRVVVPYVDVVLMPASDDGKVGKLYTKQQYRDAVETYAREMGIGFCDIYNLVGNYADANVLGYYEDDSHLSTKGYEVIASFLYRQLTGENAIHVGEHIVDGGGNTPCLTIANTTGSATVLKWSDPALPRYYQGNTYSQGMTMAYNGLNLILEGNDPFLVDPVGGMGVNFPSGTPVSELEVFTDGTGASRGLTCSYANGNTLGAMLQFRKSRGFRAIPTPVATGDNIGVISAFAFDGSNWLDMAGIEFGAEGTIAATRIPTNIRFYVANDAAPSVKAEVARFTREGFMGLGGETNPLSRLHINSGDVRLSNWYGFGWGDLSTYIYGNAALGELHLRTGAVDRLVINNASILASVPVVFPQMTKAARNALAAVNGMAIYQTDATPGMRFYENGAWVRFTATADP